MITAAVLAALCAASAVAAPVVRDAAMATVPTQGEECQKRPSRQYLQAMRDAVFADVENAPVPGGPLPDDPILWPNMELIYQFNETSLLATYNITANPKNKDLVYENQTVNSMIAGWKQTVLDAHAVLRTMSPCITIRERNEQDKKDKRHYISIGQYQRDSCWSYVGYYSNATDTGLWDEYLVDEYGSTYQPMNLYFTQATSKNPTYQWNSCGAMSNVHEHLHALGVYHEQSRPDRDNFVVILKEVIQKGKAGNFAKANITVFDSKLDWNSIMMYGSNAFANLTVGNYTILTKADSRPFLQNRKIVGQGDVDFLNQLYRCIETVPRTRPGLAQFDYTGTFNGYNRNYYKVEPLKLDPTSAKTVMNVTTWASVDDRHADELCARKCYEEKKKCQAFTTTRPLTGARDFAWCFLSKSQIKNATNDLVEYNGWNATYYNRKADVVLL